MATDTLTDLPGAGSLLSPKPHVFFVLFCFKDRPFHLFNETFVLSNLYINYRHTMSTSEVLF